MRCSGNEKLVELVFEHEWGRSIGVTVASRLWIRTKQVSSSHISIIGLNSSWTYFLFIDQCVYEIENWAQTVDWNTPLPAIWSKRVISKFFYFLSSSVHHKWHWRCWSWVTGYLNDASIGALTSTTRVVLHWFSFWAKKAQWVVIILLKQMKGMFLCAKFFWAFWAF